MARFYALTDKLPSQNLDSANKQRGGLTIHVDDEMASCGYEWDGVDVNNILKSDLFKIFEDAAFSSTIPEGVITKGSSAPSEPKNENSLDTKTFFVEIIAVDKSGTALLRSTTVNNYTDAEWSSVAAMPLKEAQAEISRVTQKYSSSRCVFK